MSRLIPHLETQNLSAYYGATKAIEDVSIIIPRNQITVIIGPSGCGKTTLLKCLNRFIELEEHARVEGKVLLNGEDIYSPLIDVTEVRKKSGLLAQRPYPLPMSIFDNVAYGMRIHGLCSRRELAQKVQYYLQVAGLWEEVKDRLHAPASQLSIGQQQRLCLARGLAVEPEIILGDEPTSALDPISAQHIEQRLIELKQQYTVVLVSHILRQARRLADYVVFMYMGKVVEAGPAQQVLNHPQHERTRAYLSGEF
ncbi:MAG: phosphate ABC transporter ATP-binding protein [Anaerolineales bacterium]|nr:phosphate ABC transporter ATP-binding protein [Anaerolineales bacterium]MCS7247305.1 phosphate ABC transporter ATP-binding protein [Anaerolineales bacterium]MDW8161116.1 phosphate ABC transporter ATP-binding protein [Anaerolineales bacterium]MDW8446055.1 phosphate ABC transporter ATP-binding protein [Anaerolineales bacterium]